MSDPNCPCDVLIHPPELRIAAGLERIPRQIAGFPEFRRAMLAEIGSHPALVGWRARGEGDLGMMLLEMWAYVADVVTFYDEVIAHEGYLRTARRRPSLRKLVALLGYRPRPAVATAALLAASAEGRVPLRLPAGVAFRSGAFDGEPPQVFELDADSTVDPLANRWRLAVPRPTTLGSGVTAALLLEPATASLEPGALSLIRVSGSHARTRVRIVAGLEPHQGADGATYARVTFDRPLGLHPATALSDVELTIPTRTAALWTLDSPLEPQATGTAARLWDSSWIGAPGNLPPVVSYLPVNPPALAGEEVILDGLHRQIRPGDRVLVSRGVEHRWFEVEEVREILMALPGNGPSSTVDVDGNPVTVEAPPVRVPATRLTLDADLNAGHRKATRATAWTAADAARITVRYGLAEAGKLTREAATAVTAGDSLSLLSAAGQPPELPADGPRRFLISDPDQRGCLETGRIEAGGKLTLDPPGLPTLRPPVEVYGNVLRASRGESVAGEVLGSGDASLAGQTFRLKKKPLTYVAAPSAANPQGIASTLRTWVDGGLWQEVPSFFGAAPEDPVYVVRHTEDGETEITFGDGVRGRRLPTGRGNVVASYRFGAGAAAPPAGAIHQMARPVKGLKSVHNPLPAAGGADAEDAENLRAHAPRSALLLGRAVSIRDFEAAAAGLPGVRAVRAEWRWHGVRQRSVVQLFYVGEANIEELVARTLRSLSDPAVALAVEHAEPVPLRLALAIQIDPLRVEETVLADVRRALSEPGVGFLSPERIGIGRPLYRSRVAEQVLACPGALAVTAILRDGEPFTGLAIDPGTGRYFDLDGGALVLNGREDSDG